MDIIAALSLGILGSVHCIGMCGPLMLALPSASAGRGRYVAGRLIYFFGKAITYGILGAVAGSVGKGLLMTLQQDISIIIGATMLLSVVLPLSVRSALSHYSPLRSLHSAVKNKFSLLLQQRGNGAMLGMGMLNGVLPCGLVYTALVGATLTAEPFRSGVVMFFFGLGTIPALFAVAWTGRLMTLRFRSLFSRAVPVVTAIVAVILILRGLNLGIPMISPKVSEPVRHETTVDCCSEH